MKRFLCLVMTAVMLFGLAPMHVHADTNDLGMRLLESNEEYQIMTCSQPMLDMIKDMDDRGKVLNMAFACSAAFVFGDHLGYTAGFEPTLIPALIVGKLAGGISAVAIAWLLTREKKEKLQHV